MDATLYIVQKPIDFLRSLSTSSRLSTVADLWAAGFVRRVAVLLLLLVLSSATVTLAQMGITPGDDTNQVPRGGTKSGNVILNDNLGTLPNSDFVVTRVSDPSQGTLALNPDGSYTYTHTAGGMNPVDSFTYRICQTGNPSNCSSTATVVLNIYNPSDVCTLGTGRNLLTNPSFTQGNTGFTTTYIFVPAPTGPNSGLYGEGYYAVDDNANAYHGGFQGTGLNGPGDKFMIVNGASALQSVYKQRVSVVPNRYYTFTVHAVSLNTGTPAQLGLVVGGKSTSVVTTLPNMPGRYERISDLYFSGPNPAGGNGPFEVDVEIKDVNKDANGNDFGIDDVYFGSCSAFLLAVDKLTPPVTNVPVQTPIIPLSATISTGGSAGITVASFTIKSLPTGGTLYYNGVPVTVGQVIPVSGPGSLSSGGTLTFLPAGGCARATPTFTYVATDSDGIDSGNIATYSIPVVPLIPTIRVRGFTAFCPGDRIRLSADPQSGYRYTWYNGSTIVNGAGAVLNDSVFIATTAGNYTVTAQLDACSGTSTPLTLTLRPPVVPGTIATTGPAICAGSTPPRITSVTGPSGGLSPLTYQWESSTNNTTWDPIPSATEIDYQPGPLTVTTYFRRKAISANTNCGSAVSEAVLITVNPAVIPGAIAGNQTVCSGTAPTQFTSETAAAGGVGSYVYQWEISTDNSTWNPVPSATEATYQPGPLTTTTRYRRSVVSTGSGCVPIASNVVTINVSPALTPGSIGPAQQLCTGTTPAPLTSVAGPGGGQGDYTYQWEVSTNNTTWDPIPNATAATYEPGPLTVTTYYRRRTSSLSSGCPAATSPAVTVTVNPAVTPGTIGGNQFVCSGSAPTRLTSLTAPSGGQGPYSYQWEKSTNNTTWEPIPNATESSYAPGPITAITYFRRRASSPLRGCTAAVSEPVTVDITPVVDVEAGPDKEVVEGRQVELEGRANGSFPVVWTPSVGLTFPSGDRLRPIASPTVTTVYTLSAGPDGCGDESRVTVTVLPPVRIPNAFSPNGDGRDDTWEIDRIGEFAGNTVTIFNRWGNQIFRATNYNRSNEWNGRINGQPAPVGTYYYVVTLGNGKSYSGPLTVVY